MASGLADCCNSLSVYDNLQIIADAFLDEYNPESLIVSALLHDLCKTNFYRRGYRESQERGTGQWEKIEVYEVHDQSYWSPLLT